MVRCSTSNSSTPSTQHCTTKTPPGMKVVVTFQPGGVGVRISQPVAIFLC